MLRRSLPRRLRQVTVRSIVKRTIGIGTIEGRLGTLLWERFGGHHIRCDSSIRQCFEAPVIAAWPCGQLSIFAPMMLLGTVYVSVLIA